MTGLRGLSVAEPVTSLSFLNYKRIANLWSSIRSCHIQVRILFQSVARAAMDFSGNPDRDIIKNQSPSPPPPLAATTYLIVAERAIRHLECNLPQIGQIFSSFQIPRSDYGVCAGFDQEQVRLGFFEQIHVFIRSEVHDMPSLLSGLGSIFAPFPAILFTETSSYDIPVSEAADSTDTHTHPMAICLTHASQSDPPKGFGSGMGSNRQNNGNNNEGSTDRQEELNDKPSNLNKNDLGQGPESEPSGREGNQANWTAGLTWDIISEICSSQPSEPRVVSQFLGTKGKVMIERTSEGVEPNQFATCKVQFTDLTFQNKRQGKKMNYGHFYTTININSLQSNADISYFKPKRTRKFAESSKVTSTSKIGMGGTASSTFAATIAPQPTFGLTLGANAAWTRESTTGTEKTANISRIIQTDMNGSIEWGFCFGDPHETEGGMLFNQLPRADFMFIGDDETPAPPPQQMNIEIRTYWSSLPHSDSKSWPLLNLGNKPFYSNLCQISVLNVPSDLRKDYVYKAVVYVFPQPKAVEFTVYEVDVQRRANPITLTVGVDNTEQGFNGDETGEWTGESGLSEYRESESDDADQPGE